MLKRAIRTGRAVTVVAVVMLAVALGPAGPAAADTQGNCTLGIICGYTKNLIDSDESLRITTDWGRYTDPATWRYLSPGQDNNHIGIKDSDGFYIWADCTAYIGSNVYQGPRWQRVRDGQSYYVRLDCYSW
jgi:hypothetical protein